MLIPDTITFKTSDIEDEMRMCEENISRLGQDLKDSSGLTRSTMCHEISRLSGRLNLLYELLGKPRL